MVDIVENDTALLQRAKEVLQQNWLGAATKPAPRLYPHQWSWDSAFIAMGYAHYSQEQAMQELRSLFRGQWRNGLVPHIVFCQEDCSAYFPGPDYWQAERSPHAPQDVATSGIIQPPVHATAAWQIYQYASDLESAKAFLAELYPQLVAWHQYLYRERNPDGDGLIYIRHPWESGQDNSPLWDEALAQIEITPGMLPAYKRVDLNEVSHTNRPSNLDYDRYVYLLVQARDCGYDEVRIRESCPFVVQDVLFNALLIQANCDLVAIARLLHQDPTPFEAWAKQTTAALNQKLWNPQQGIYQNYDWVSQKQVSACVAAGFSPLYARVPNAEQAQQMLENLSSEAFCGGSGWMVPSTSREEPSFCPTRYWRGPIWLNLNWLLYRGLRHYGFDEVGDRLKANSINLVRQSGFYEYFHPDTGEGLGSGDFSWTAALLIDLLMEER